MSRDGAHEDNEFALPRLDPFPGSAHPAVGPFDADRVVRAFLDTIGAEEGVPRLMARAWSDAALVAVERRPPIATATGKILHLHARGAAATPSPDR